jgi:hypothetical protein
LALPFIDVVLVDSRSTRWSYGFFSVIPLPFISYKFFPSGIILLSVRAMSVRQSGYSFRGSLALLLSAKKEEF